MNNEFFRQCKQLPQSLVDESSYLVKSRGFSLIENFMPGELCELLRSKLERAIEQYNPRVSSQRSFLDRYHIHDLMNQDMIFCSMLEDVRLQQLLSPLIDEYWIMYAFTSSSLPPNEENFGSRLHNDCPRFSPGYIFNIGLIWLLDDFYPENGSTFVLPGSHHLQEAPSEELFDRNCMQLEAKKGTLLIFNAGLFHRAGLNSTNEWRHALTLNACRSFMKQRMDWVRFIQSEFTNQLNEQARRILGFDTRLPTTMEELFLPEEDRLYKAKQG